MGFLNPSDDDNYRIDSMPGTTQVPNATGLDGMLTAIPKGIVEGGVKIGTLGTAISDKLQSWDDSVTGETQADRDAAYAKTYGWMSLAGPVTPATIQQERAQSAAATQIVSDWASTGQDPRVTGTTGRIAAGAAEGITIGAAGNELGGPVGAAALLGSSEGYSDYLQGKQQGLDDQTALERAGLTGVFSAAGAFLPMKFGTSLTTSLLGGAATNMAFGAAQRYATSAVLADNGYKAMADQYRVFDGQAMAADAVMGLAFGSMGHFSHVDPAHVNPADIDAAAAVSAEDQFNRSAPGVPTNPEVANLHADTMAQALKSLADGDAPKIEPDTAQKIVDGSLPDPAQEFTSQIVETARTELPGFDEAATPVKEQALPEETLAPMPEPIEPEPLKEGEERQPKPAPLDDFHNDLLQNLVHNNPDAQYTTEDGRQVTFQQMSDELQSQRNDADQFGKLHEIAAACAARNGG